GGPRAHRLRISFQLPARQTPLAVASPAGRVPARAPLDVDRRVHFFEALRPPDLQRVHGLRDGAVRPKSMRMGWRSFGGPVHRPRSIIASGGYEYAGHGLNRSVRPTLAAVAGDPLVSGAGRWRVQ